MKDLTYLLNGLNEAAKIIHQGNVEKGFWDGERNVGELLMLVTSELGEAMEAHRKNRFANIEQAQKLIDLGGQFELTFKEYLKDTFEDEIADSVIRLLDLCAGLGIDLETHIKLKVKYNRTRPRLHGKAY